MVTTTRIRFALMAAIVVGLFGFTTVAQGYACTYTVQPGDNLSTIAKQYGVEVWEIQTANQDDYPIWVTLQPGWVLAVPCLEGQSPPPADTGPPPVSDINATATVNLNMRSWYDTSYQIVGLLPTGTTAPIEARSPNNSWLLIQHEGQRGWVAGWLVNTSAATTGLPISNEVIDGAVAPPPEAPEAPEEPSTPAAEGYTGTFYNVGPHLRETYNRGRALGNLPNRFTVVGDSETNAREFLLNFDDDIYSLGQYNYLQGVVDYYAGSFARKGLAVADGYPAEIMFESIWADPTLCYPGEGPLECEYRLWKPAVALILIRTQHPSIGYDGYYYGNLTDIVQYSLNQGVIPVLSTSPYWGPNNVDTEVLNATIRAVANENNVPLWDLYATTETLPGRGVNPLDTYHTSRPESGGVTAFTEENLEAGKTRRNLEALEVLHMLLTEVYP